MPHATLLCIHAQTMNVCNPKPSEYKPKKSELI